MSSRPSSRGSTTPLAGNSPRATRDSSSETTGASTRSNQGTIRSRQGSNTATQGSNVTTQGSTFAMQRPIVASQGGAVHAPGPNGPVNMVSAGTQTRTHPGDHPPSYAEAMLAEEAWRYQEQLPAYVEAPLIHDHRRLIHLCLISRRPSVHPDTITDCPHFRTIGGDHRIFNSNLATLRRAQHRASNLSPVIEESNDPNIVYPSRIANCRCRISASNGSRPSSSGSSSSADGMRRTMRDCRGM